MLNLFSGVPQRVFVKCHVHAEAQAGDLSSLIVLWGALAVFSLLLSLPLDASPQRHPISSRRRVTRKKQVSVENKKVTAKAARPSSTPRTGTPSKSKSTSVGPPSLGSALVPMPSAFSGYTASGSPFWPELEKEVQFGGPGDSQNYLPGRMGAPQGDPLQVIASDYRKGRLFYLVKPVVNGQAHNWQAVFRGLGGITGTLTNSKTEIPIMGDAASYEILWNFKFWDPDFSPDGNIVAFKQTGNILGDPRVSDYDLVVWDLKRRCISSIGPSSWPNHAWSADSQWLGYVEGGNERGKNIVGLTDPPALYAQSLAQTFGEFPLVPMADGRVAQNQSDAGRRLICNATTCVNFAWDGSHLLLVTKQSPHQGQSPVKGDPSIHPQQNNWKGFFYPTTFCDIYETDIDQNPANDAIKHALEPLPSHLLITNGFEPVPCPVGRWIAFTGWKEDVQKDFVGWPPRANLDGQMGISPDALLDFYLYDRTTGKRILIRKIGRQTSSRLFPRLMWSPDGRKLVLLQQIYAASNDPKQIDIGIWTLNIEQVELALAQSVTTQIDSIPGSFVNNDAWHEVTRIKQSEFSNPLPGVFRSIEAKSVSNDGKSLVLSVEEELPSDKGRSMRQFSLLSIDLTDGTRQMLAKLPIRQGTGEGIAWHEELVRVTSNSSSGSTLNEPAP